MKHLKMLGLTAVAAMALMAFAGAGTASATTLCTTNEESCTMVYPTGTTLHATLQSGTSADLKTTGGTTIATCTESTVHGGTNNATGTWVESNISTVTWGGCNQTTDTIGNGLLKIMKNGTNQGEVVGVGNRVTLNVFGTTCTYGTGEGTVLGNITGGSLPAIAINAVLSKVEGNFLCPATGVWTATYILTEPHAVFVVN